MPVTIAPDRAHDLHLGRSAPSPKPKISMAEIVDVEKAKALIGGVPEQHAINMAWRIKSWPMFLNDQKGNCTCASVAHGKQVSCVYSTEPFTVTDANVDTMYEASGYDPSKDSPDGNPTDQGWTLAAAAGYARTKGLTGTPDIDAYAEVDHRDPDQEEVAHYLFGGLSIGASMPSSAQGQYQAGQEWTPTNNGADAGTWGGHAMWRVRSILRNRIWLVTWGGLQQASQAWDDAYIDEAMAFVWRDWEKRMPAYLQGHGLVDYAKLASLLAQVTTPGGEHS